VGKTQALIQAQALSSCSGLCQEERDVPVSLAAAIAQIVKQKRRTWITSQVFQIARIWSLKALARNPLAASICG